MRFSGELWAFNTRDLMRASTCRHCTVLSLGKSLGVEVVVDKIENHKTRVRAQGRDPDEQTLPMRFGDIFESDLTDELSGSLPQGLLQRPAQKRDLAGTVELMALGVPIIYQGYVEHPDGQTQFQGMPDFLVRSDWRLVFEQGKLTAFQADGDNSKYTAWDAKYSSHPKPEYALQVAAYIDALDFLGFKAENAKHGLILGNRTIESLGENEVVPAMRLARGVLTETIGQTSRAISEATEEFFASFTWHCDSPKECSICEHPELCEEERKAADDLLLVAGLGKTLKAKLVNSGIRTMSELASPGSSKPKGVSRQTFEKVKAQARIQTAKTSNTDNHWELLPDPMLQYLPKPSRNDVFFDMEGFPYFPDGGLEYLFGNWTDEEGFTGFWAHTREQEKTAFEEFMKWLSARMEEDPAAHIFHYAPYERTALRKLSARHGTMRRELTKLEDEARFVDLYPAVTKSLRVSEPRYSIKNLEKFYGFERSADVKKADDSIEGYFDWLTSIERSKDLERTETERETARQDARLIFDALEKYNTEDVQSTQRLYQWLLTFDGAASRFGENLIKVRDDDAELSESEQKIRQLEEITDVLFAATAGMQQGQSPQLDTKIAAWETLAHSILFYQRESLMFWANLHIRLQQDDDAIQNDREAILISDVIEVSREDKVDKNNKPYTRVVYSAAYDTDSLYEPRAKDRLAIRFMLPGQTAARNSGDVIAAEAGRIQFSRLVREEAHLELTPDALFQITVYNTDSKQSGLNELAETLIRRWGSPEHTPPTDIAAVELLLRNSPSNNQRAFTSLDSLNYLPAIIEAADQLSGQTLAVQGPPGTGKTYLASRLIKHLIDTGRKVAVTANSHVAIHNVLENCVDAGVNPEVIFKTHKENDSGTYPWNVNFKADQTGRSLKKHQGNFVLGGTHFALCNKNIREHKVDFLIVDEAAQFSLVDTLAVSGIAENIILFGDPQQLPQVVQASHPGGVENSALGHFIGHNDIVPKELGFFVEVTRRLHPEINKHISWLAYENKLQAHPDTVNNEVPGTPPGLHPVAVRHSGNSTHSPEEVEEVLELVARHAATLPPEEILIVAPYNAQVNAIRKALDEQGFNDVEVGTVDKFQGREGMVVIVSLAASNADDAPRGLGFLLDRNRLNVAISRAKSVCYLVHSPDLLRASFSSLEDVKSVSRLAKLVD